MGPMKLDKWDVGIGIIVGSWVILQILRLLMLYAGFNVWGVDPVVIVYLIVPSSSGWIGVLFLIGSGIVLLVRAFKKSKSWGLAALFIPFAALVFVFKHWNKSWRPVLASLLGAAIIMIEILIWPALILMQ